MKWEDMITRKIGADTRAWLKSLRGDRQKTDARFTNLYLTQKLEEYSK